MKIVAISDTHERHSQLVLPDGDILIHAGDATMLGQEHDVEEFNKWLGALPHKHKVFIAGNHDFLFEKRPSRAKEILTNAIYLEDSGIEIEGVKIWGSPMTPWFFDWAFNRMRGPKINKHWQIIPEKVDVLVTHGPPMGVLDRTSRDSDAVGCEMLAHAVDRVRPRVHIFGHIHGGYGYEFDKERNVHFYNASVVNEAYLVVNAPHIIEL